MKIGLWLIIASLLVINFAASTPRPCQCRNDLMECSHRNRTAILLSEVCNLATRVRLGGNKLQSFPDGLHVNAVDVDISQNSLSMLPNSSQLNPMIQVLDISGNGIVDTSDELKRLAALEVLDVRGNKLKSLSFLPEPCSLRRFEASWNHISSVSGPLFFCSRLVKLNLGHNKISLLPPGLFSQMISLKILVLNDNNLIQLPKILFSSLMKLSELYLEENNIIHIHNDQFKGLHSLRRLTLANNRLLDLPLLGDCCAQMQWISIASNNVTNVSKSAVRPLLGFGRRRLVDLSGNPMRADSLSWLMRSAELRVTVREDDCACGEILRGRAVVLLCVQVDCGRRKRFSDWLDAVRTAEREAFAYDLS